MVVLLQPKKDEMVLDIPFTFSRKRKKSSLDIGINAQVQSAVKVGEESEVATNTETLYEIKQRCLYH